MHFAWYDLIKICSELTLGESPPENAMLLRWFGRSFESKINIVSSLREIKYGIRDQDINGRPTRCFFLRQTSNSQYSSSTVCFFCSWRACLIVLRDLLVIFWSKFDRAFNRPSRNLMFLWYQSYPEFSGFERRYFVWTIYGYDYIN